MESSIAPNVLTILKAESNCEEERDEKERRWLREELGLRFDPFRHLDAGADPHLPAYLVDHDAFIDLWGDWPSFLFAPAGGGKTAFRVRLARACRVEQAGRRVFPIIFYPPSPSAEGEAPGEHATFEALLHGVGVSLLFQLAYKPDQFLDLEVEKRKKGRHILEQHFPGSLDYYLAQLEDAGSLTPLAQAFDRTAVGLPAEPSAERIRTLCVAIRQTPSMPPGSYDPRKRILEITKWLIQDLGYESVYLLVDGVDAYVQEPSFVVRLLDPILGQLRAWAEQALFAKFFLPEQLQPVLEKSYPKLLTPPSKTVIIKWNRQLLVRVIRERLYWASDGMYDSLEAISTRDVGGQVEEDLAKMVRVPLPRNIVGLARRVFIEHIERVGPYGRLESQDFAAARAWHESQEGARS